VGFVRRAEPRGLQRSAQPEPALVEHPQGGNLVVGRRTPTEEQLELGVCRVRREVGQLPHSGRIDRGDEGHLHRALRSVLERSRQRAEPLRRTGRRWLVLVRGLRLLLASEPTERIEETKQPTEESGGPFLNDRRRRIGRRNPGHLRRDPRHGDHGHAKTKGGGDEPTEALLDDLRTHAHQ
jgi:hypothetical protein